MIFCDKKKKVLFGWANLSAERLAQNGEKKFFLTIQNEKCQKNYETDIKNKV